VSSGGAELHDSETSISVGVRVNGFILPPEESIRIGGVCNVLGVVGVGFRDWVGGAQGFCFMNGAHVLSEGIGAGERAVTF